MKKNMLSGKKKLIPISLVVLALAAAGAGAAAGTILAGKVTGEVPVAVSQALLVEAVSNTKLPVTPDATKDEAVMTQQVFDNWTMVHIANRFIGVKSDDNTGFQAGMEIATGDWTEVNLQLKNASANDLVALLTLDVPQGLEVEAFGSTYADNAADAPNYDLDVTNVTRVGLNTWKLIVKGGTNKDDVDSLLHLIISSDDDSPPGYYSISGTIKQIAY